MLLFMPTLVYSEENCVQNHFKDIALIGEKAMIVTGKHSSRANGSLNDVTEVLKQEKPSWCEEYLCSFVEEKIGEIRMALE